MEHKSFVKPTWAGFIVFIGGRNARNGGQSIGTELLVPSDGSLSGNSGNYQNSRRNKRMQNLPTTAPKEEPLPNEIDRLMDLDPLELSAQDIDEIIKYQRKMKANFDAGIKSGRAKTVADAPSVDLKAMLQASLTQSGTPQVQVRRSR